MSTIRNFPKYKSKKEGFITNETDKVQDMKVSEVRLPSTWVEEKWVELYLQHPVKNYNSGVSLLGINENAKKSVH